MADERASTDRGAGPTGLLASLRTIIQGARQRALREVDVVQVQTCWEIGRHIVEFEQGGAARAEYGARLLPTLAHSLTEEFGRGFDSSNLRYMRLFYQAFPIRDAVRHELSRTTIGCSSGSKTRPLGAGTWTKLSGRTGLHAL